MIVGVLLVGAVIAGCGSSSGSGPVTLNWYVFPEPSGSFASAAADCSKASGGRYRIKINNLSTDSTQQRVSLVRRLAAKDSSIDILAMDVDWTAEFATAKWIRPVPPSLAAEVRSVDLPGPIQTATWKGTIWAVPINSNTQLLWYRKDIVPRPPKSWSQMIDDAIGLAKQGKPHYIEEQGAQYEGLTVWFNSLVNSAGGQIITPSNKVVIGPTAGIAAAIMQRLASSPAADPSLNVNKEDQARVGFEKGGAAFEINYPFVWPAAAKAGIQGKMGFAPFPAVLPATQPRVSIGGYNLGVSAYVKHPSQAFEAVRCLTREPPEIVYAVKGGLAPVRAAVYRLPAHIRGPFVKQYPFYKLIEQQLTHYGIRPQTPAYEDVTIAIQKALSPPAGIQPKTIVSTLRGEIKAALSSSALL
jgi:multiple sugar transport system substrate-binding protein